MVYRLVIQTAPGRVDTGATYPQCSLTNQAACQPIQFKTTNEAFAYARSKGETPVMVKDREEAWDIVAGKKSPQTGPSMTTIGLVLAGAYLLLRGR